MQSQRPVPIPFKERRKGPDLIVRLVYWSSLIGWILFIIALMVSHEAKPEMNTGLVRYWQIPIRSEWNEALMPAMLGLLWWSCITSLISIGLNRLRLRRRHDQVRSNAIILLVVALGALSYFYSV